MKFSGRVSTPPLQPRGARGGAPPRGIQLAPEKNNFRLPARAINDLDRRGCEMKNEFA
jgi:hypothetical protein